MKDHDRDNRRQRVEMDPIIVRRSSARRQTSALLIWGAFLLAWFVALCIIPDPRPLGAPQWSVRAMQSLVGLPEPGARAVATIVMRGIGLGLLGILLSLSVAPWPMTWAAPVVLVVAPLLAVASQWLNYGYFPILMQIQLGVASAVIGALAGLSLRRSPAALAALVMCALVARRDSRLQVKVSRLRVEIKAISSSTVGV